MTNQPDILNARLNSDGYFYLIGTSRMEAIDPNLIERITKEKTHSIKINGSTLRENKFLAQEVKKRDKNFIYGFDVFSLNANRNAHKEISARYTSYKNELANNNLLTKYFNSDITIRSFQHMGKKFKKYPYDIKHIEDNNAQHDYSFHSILEDSGIANDFPKKNFTNYKMYEDNEIIELAKTGTKNDIFIIFPKHVYYYTLFQEHQNIEEQYFHAIKLLVQNTNAQVWSFYSSNSITTNKENFDKNGWHFKPKISSIMFKKIFEPNHETSPDDFGILLTHENIDDYLRDVHDQIARIKY